MKSYEKEIKNYEKEIKRLERAIHNLETESPAVRAAVERDISTNFFSFSNIAAIMTLWFLIGLLLSLITLSFYYFFNNNYFFGFLMFAGILYIISELGIYYNKKSLRENVKLCGRGILVYIILGYLLALVSIKYPETVFLFVVVFSLIYTIYSSITGDKAINQLKHLKNRKHSLYDNIDSLEQAIQKEELLKFEKKQRAKGLVKYDNMWGTPKQVKKWKEIGIGLNNNFADLSPYEFEEFVAGLFQKMGYSARKTPNTGDFGADVIATKKGETVLIEVKKYAEGNNVTPKEVQRTLGAIWKYKADKAVFVTTSDFTVRAREVESEGPIELWNKRILHQMVRKYFIETESENK